jgi:four helix bundle protein
MQDFRKLVVWQKAHQLALRAYAVSSLVSQPRYFHFCDQFTRAALSIPANLAEGCGRSGDKEFRKFARVSLGSSSELEYHLLFARDLGLLPGPVYEELTAATSEVKRMLSGLVARLTDQITAQAER